jgi:hypothetical protein
MAGNFQRPERKKNALDNTKLKMSAPTPGHQGKYANLVWGLYSNNPRITVYTGDPNDAGEQNGWGKISANLDAPIFFAFLKMLHDVIDAPPDTKNKIENKNFIFPGGKRSEKPVVTSELWVGKDKDGIIWISVSARDRPKIKFNFNKSDFHEFYHGNGEPYTPAESSAVYARGYITLLEGLMTTMLDNHWVEPPPRDPPGGGGQRGGGGGYGGGGGQRSGGGGYGGGSGGGGGGSTSGGDDDIPF